MVNVFTIKEMVPMERYGFESSQLARQQLMKELSIKHQLIITNLHSFVPNFVEQMEGLGFDNFYHVILDLSDVARQKPSIAKEMLPSFQNVERVEYTKEGYVGLVYYEDGSIECYTLQLLFHFNSKEDIFTLYNSKGVLLEGNVREVYHAYRFTETGEVYSQWQLVSLYLSEHSTAKDKFIIDMVNEYPLQLRKFFQNTGRELYAYTHYNILAPFMKFLLQNWCKNIVASSVLESRLGSDVVKFLPPIYVDGVKTEVYQEVRDWCIVGNMTIVKKCELAIEAFRQVPGSKLTIYGILPKGITKESLPENVI